MRKTRGSFVNCTFEINSAKCLPHQMVYGGAISSGDRSNITVQHSLFKENTATYIGGGIDMQKTYGSFGKCTFERNSAKSLPSKKMARGARSARDMSNITVQESLFKDLYRWCYSYAKDLRLICQLYFSKKHFERSCRQNFVWSSNILR